MAAQRPRLLALLPNATLAYVGMWLLKVYVNLPDADCGVTLLWKLVDTIEELDCWFETPRIFVAFAHLGPASIMKVFQPRGGAGESQGILPKNFQSRFSSSRRG